MEVKLLNCVSCGAPISIPEDVDFLNCASCGSFLGVQRGEGYIALKMVKEVADAIKKSGAETQSAIRDGTYATRTELQKLQLTQEISMVEMQLSTIQGETRGLERALQPGVANPRLIGQLQYLHFQEFQLLERIRNLRESLFAVNSPEFENDPATLENQLSSIRSGIQALEKSDKSRPSVYNALAKQKMLAEQISNKLLQKKIQVVKSSLNSFGLTSQFVTDPETAIKYGNWVRKDIQILEGLSQTPENTAVLNELYQRFTVFNNQWCELETQFARINSQSLNLPDPKDLNISSIEVNLFQIQSDIQTLSSRKENDITRPFLENLRSKERKYQQALSKAKGKLSRR